MMEFREDRSEEVMGKSRERMQCKGRGGGGGLGKTVERECEERNCMRFRGDKQHTEGQHW